MIYSITRKSRIKLLPRRKRYPMIRNDLRNLSMSKKESTQSIAVSEEEQLLIKILAKSKGLKPSTAARKLLYRGLHHFSLDRSLDQEKLEDEVIDSINELIERDS